MTTDTQQPDKAMSTPTPEHVARVFNAPLANVKAQYAKNAKQLRELAAKAQAIGSYRGKTAAYWTERAEYFERQSQ